jgi:serine/threonine protein kinase
MTLHHHQILHRDLKPDDIFLNDDIEPRLPDFNLSKVVDTGRLMDQSSIKGTLLYQAHELFRGDDLGFFMDVYAYHTFWRVPIRRRAQSQCFRVLNARSQWGSTSD